MSEMPSDRKGRDNMVTPVKNAANAPDGDSERLRKPCPARKVAMRIGTNGRSDTLTAMSRMTTRGKSRLSQDHAGATCRAGPTDERKI